MSRQSVSGSFTATGQSATLTPWVNTGNAGEALFNVSIGGTFVGTVELERSFDGGDTWYTCSRDSAGTDASFTAPASVVATEPESGIQYRLNCTAYTSGTITYRISQ